jgi:hypothetical protein
MDSTFIITYLQDHFRPPTAETIDDMVKSHSDSLTEIIKGRAYAFYAAPLKSGTISKLECDVLMGYYAEADCSFKMRCGPLHSEFSLGAGEFRPAYYGGPIPIIATIDNCVISNLEGRGYAVYATLAREQRRIVSTGSYNFHDAFHRVHESIICNHIQYVERKRSVKPRPSWCSKICRYKTD